MSQLLLTSSAPPPPPPRPSVQIPFFTGLSGGLYESMYVVIPGTASIVEILGDYTTRVPISENHIRISSTQQFCTPKRRRLRRLRMIFGPDDEEEAAKTTKAGTGPNGSSRRGSKGMLKGRRLRAERQIERQDESVWGRAEDNSFPLGPNALGIAYAAGDADTNKTTIAGCDPHALILFSQRYLGGGPIQQHRGVPADGQCAKLAWARVRRTKQQLNYAHPYNPYECGCAARLRTDFFELFKPPHTPPPLSTVSRWSRRHARPPMACSQCSSGSSLSYEPISHESRRIFFTPRNHTLCFDTHDFFNCTAPHRTAPHRTAPHCTAPHRTAPHRTRPIG
jgi:hypothetical protein